MGFPLNTFTSPVHCTEAENTARRLLFMIRRFFTELSSSVYCAIVRSHLEYGMEANAPTLKADINKLRRAKRLATRLVRDLRHVPYEERLHQFNLFSLERRRLRADLILAFKASKGNTGLRPSAFFLRPPRAGPWGHTYRRLQEPSRLGRRSGAFLGRVVKYWKRFRPRLST